MFILYLLSNLKFAIWGFGVLGNDIVGTLRGRARNLAW